MFSRLTSIHTQKRMHAHLKFAGGVWGSPNGRQSRCTSPSIVQQRHHLLLQLWSQTRARQAVLTKGPFTRSRSTAPALRVVADVRHSPALLVRRGGLGSKRLHRVVRSSHLLILGSPLGEGQHVKVGVRNPRPTRRRGRFHSQREFSGHRFGRMSGRHEMSGSKRELALGFEPESGSKALVYGLLCATWNP